MHAIKIAIIGAGSVGTTLAYTLMQRNLPAEIDLIDVNEKRCKGEILDLQDALPFYKTSTIKSGAPTDAKNADIIIIAAGARQAIGQSRIELLQQNEKIIADIIKQITPLKKDAILIMVTNPVDILTMQALKLSKLPETQVFGSGTILDSMRLRELIAEHLKLSPRSIHAYVLGEHGESQVPAWSISSIAGTPILEHPNLDINILSKLSQEARNRVYEIISCKGATFYGVASCVASMIENIIFDQKIITLLSCWSEEYQLCMSLPCILGKTGIEKQLLLKLSEHEQQLLKSSAETLRKSL